MTLLTCTAIAVGMVRICVVGRVGGFFVGMGGGEYSGKGGRVMGRSGLVAQHMMLKVGIGQG